MSDALPTQGIILKRGNGATPEVFTAVSEVADINGPDGSAAEIDVTHLASTAKEFLIGLPDEGQVTVTLNYVPGNAQQNGLRTDRNAQTKRNFQIVLPAGQSTPAETFDFAAFVTQWAHGMSPDDKVVLNVTLRVTGAVAKS